MPLNGDSTPAPEDTEVLTVTEFAQRARVRPEAVQRWIAAGTVYARNVGTKGKPVYEIPASEWRRMLRGGTTEDGR